MAGHLCARPFVFCVAARSRSVVFLINDDLCCLLCDWNLMSMPQFGSGSAPGAAPSCKNHSDRVTYVRCQRCGDPICPECTNQAAVGVQCPQCVREGSRAVRAKTTMTGAKVTDGRPVVTMTIIGICVVMFVAQLVLGWDKFTSELVFAPSRAQAEPYRFITGAFLHAASGGWLVHILFNMMALWAIGPQLESMLGRWRYIVLYLLAAIGGNVSVLMFSSIQSGTWNVGTLGASGAIFGLFGALVPVIRKVGGDMRSIYGLIGINLVIGFIVPNVSWEGHLGGLITGMALGYLFVRAPKDKRMLYSAGGSVLVFAILAGLSLWKFAQFNAILSSFGIG